MDIVNRIIAIFILAFMLIIGPLANVALLKDRTAKRDIYNEMTLLVDKVTDTGQLTAKQLADFKLAIAEKGMAAETTVTKFVKIATKEADGTITTQWVASETIDKLNKGDLFKVKVRAIDYTTSQKYLMYFLKLATPEFEVEQVGYVRG